MTDNVCAVIGAGPGIGLSVAKRFGKGGFRVGLIARRREALEEHAAAVHEAGAPEVGIYTADAERAHDLQHALTALKSDLGPPRVLIYNAAVLRAAKPTGLGVDQLVRDFRVNVGGALVAAQAVEREMREAGEGTILFTGGGLALEPWPDFASLAIGKAGIRSLAHSLAKELEPEGVHVGTVTICGVVKEGTKFEPDAIAEKYWELYANEKKGDPKTFVREVVYE